jgi:hypothetical protein
MSYVAPEMIELRKHIHGILSRPDEIDRENELKHAVGSLRSYIKTLPEFGAQRVAYAGILRDFEAEAREPDGEADGNGRFLLALRHLACALEA